MENGGAQGLKTLKNHILFLFMSLAAWSPFYFFWLVLRRMVRAENQRAYSTCPKHV